MLNKIVVCLFAAMQFICISNSGNAEINFRKNIQTDTLLTNYLSEINADSIKSTILSLQNMGTRFALSGNRKMVAEWIRNKFISIGYNNAYIDSFENNDYISTMQYNVIATLVGNTNPDIFYIVGGHHDNFSESFQNALVNAPGADDNASGTAATIEVARVLKKRNYNSTVSIRFITFACEELGLYGSMDYANKARNTNQDIRMMVNCDMISAEPLPGPWTVNLQKYDNSNWVTSLAKYISLNYTTLLVNETSESIQGSDSYSFYEYGFKTVFLEEYDFSDVYHSNGDTLGNCNMPYCAEITKVACGMVLQQTQHPEVLNLHAEPLNNDIRVSWNKSNESNVLGYSIYRSLNPSGGFTKLNSVTINKNDTVYIDPAPVPLTDYFYAVVTVDEMDAEGEIFQYDSAMVLTLDQGILVVDDSQNEFLSPTDYVVDKFYDSLLYEYQPHHYDAMSQGAVSLSELGKYSTVVWHTDKYSTSSKLIASQSAIKRYLKSGGKMLFTAERFAYTTEHSYSPTKTFYPGSFTYDFMHCDSIYRNSNARFFKARTIASEYPSMEIDTLKTPVTSNHHLGYIESLHKRSDANYIYAYDCLFDSTSVQGSMKSLPVGIEYLGNDYKLIVLSFPLWYIRFDDAHLFINHAMQNVFNELVSRPETKADKGNNVLFPCYPNPFSETTTIKYYLSKSEKVTLEIYDITGKLVKVLVSAEQLSGAYTQVISGDMLESGIYFCTLRTGTFSETTKLVLIK